MGMNRTTPNVGPWVVAVAALAVLAGCGSDGGVDPKYTRLGECITPEDGYTTCDEYCAATGQMCVEEILMGDEIPEEHDCTVMLGDTPFVGAANKYETGNMCSMDNRVVDGTGGACDAFLWDEPPGGGLVPTAIRCCCG